MEAPAVADVAATYPRRGAPGPHRPLTLRFAHREAVVWAKLWHGTVFSWVVSPLLFLGAMGLGLGGLVDDNAGSVDGIDYLTFVAPGLLAAWAMQTSAGESLWHVMAGQKWLGNHHAAVATPLRPGDVYGGLLVWSATRTGIGAIPFIGTAALLGAVPSPWGVLAIPGAVLCGVAFTAPLTAYTATQDSDASFPVIMRLIILPMFLFSGTFFPIDDLPAGLRPLAWVSPLWHGVELCRGATTGSIALGPALGHVAFLATLIAVGAVWGVRNFTRRLTP